MWGMSYVRTEDPGMKPPCETLGHFYEDFACIYCPARFCATEKGGHSFEGEDSSYKPLGDYSASPRFCYHCKRKVVNLKKG